MGFLGDIIGGVSSLATGGVLGPAMTLGGGLLKAFSKNKPAQMQSQLTPEQKKILTARYAQLQSQMNDPTARNYITTAGNYLNNALRG